MLRILTQLDQRQTRLGILNVLGQVATRNLETRGSLQRRFDDAFFRKERVHVQDWRRTVQRLKERQPALAKHLEKRGRSIHGEDYWLYAAERWASDARVLSGLLSVDEGRTGVYLDLARWCGIIGNTYGLTEAGVILKAIQPARTELENREYNPLLIQDRVQERALITMLLLQADTVTPFFLRELVDNFFRTAGNRTEVQCLYPAVEALLSVARSGAGLTHALAVRDVVEYRDRLKSENASWHNSRPRVEFLVDLGLLQSEPSTANLHAPTDAGLRAAKLWQSMLDEPRRVQQILDHHFFGVFAAIHGLSLEPVNDSESRLFALANAFRAPVVRPVGHTPARSIALLACLDFLSRGRLVEISDLLETLRSESHGRWAALISFSGGSRLDGEFLIRLDKRLVSELRGADSS